MKLTENEILEFLDEARAAVLEDSSICCHKKIPDTDLCLVVAQPDEYEDSDIIASIKVCVSAMQTDYNLDFNFPFFSNDGDCIVAEHTLCDDNSDAAEYFLEEIEEMSKYIIDDRTGEILGNKVVENLRKEIDDLVSALSDKEDFEIMSTTISEADITDEEKAELRQDLEDALYRYTQLMAMYDMYDTGEDHND